MTAGLARFASTGGLPATEADCVPEYFNGADVPEELIHSVFPTFASPAKATWNFEVWPIMEKPMSIVH
jgi:hypothetical protein